MRSLRSVSSLRNGFVAVGIAAALVLTPAARGQFGPPDAGTQVHDPAALKPPAGARVAIVEFEDMECPDCARANPLLREAAAKYRIPWVRHDFPLPQHAARGSFAGNAKGRGRPLPQTDDKADFALTDTCRG